MFDNCFISYSIGSVVLKTFFKSIIESRIQVFQIKINIKLYEPNHWFKLKIQKVKLYTISGTFARKRTLCNYRD